MPNKTIILKRDGQNGWKGELNGKPIVFPETSAGNAYRLLADKYKDVQIGFKAADMGPACVAVYGDIIWMNKKESAA